MAKTYQQVMNEARASVPEVSPEDVHRGLGKNGKGAVLLDVREREEFRQGFVPGAVSMPLATVPLRHQELPRDRTLHLICQAGGRSAQAAAWLAKQGYQVDNVAGGTGAWVGKGHPVRMGRRPR